MWSCYACYAVLYSITVGHRQEEGGANNVAIRFLLLLQQLLLTFQPFPGSFPSTFG